MSLHHKSNLARYNKAIVTDAERRLGSHIKTSQSFSHIIYLSDFDLETCLNFSLCGIRLCAVGPDKSEHWRVREYLLSWNRPSYAKNKLSAYISQATKISLEISISQRVHSKVFGAAYLFVCNRLFVSRKQLWKY